jgi:hypothetical protein
LARLKQSEHASSPESGGRTGDPEQSGDGSAIDFQVGRNVPAEIRRSDDNETATQPTGGVLT